MQQEDNIEKSAAEGAKRRHARPLELDSDDEDEEEDKTHHDSNQTSEQVDVIKPAEDPQIMVNACKLVIAAK